MSNGPKRLRQSLLIFNNKDTTKSTSGLCSLIQNMKQRGENDLGNSSKLIFLIIWTFNQLSLSNTPPVLLHR